MIYTLREGDKGQPVADLQRKLPKCKADGIWGAKTTKAVKAYQKKAKLTQDGVAGPDTLNALGLYPCLVIDVSHWQGRVNWTAVKADGVQAAIIKCSEGLTHRDSKYALNVAGCKLNDIPAAAYHFARPNNDPVEEAKAAVAAAAPLKVIHLDVEEAGGLAPEALGDWIAEWCACVEGATGQKGMIYTASWFAKPNLDNGAVLPKDLGWPLWVADYIRSGVRQTSSDWTGTWDRQLLWQWTGNSQEIAGIKGKCDVNWLFSVDGKASPAVSSITEPGAGACEV